MVDSNKISDPVITDIRVLLADNDVSRQLQVESCLSSLGYSVSTVSDGFAALSSVVADVPDIVFADAFMPRLDGYQLCSLIKSNADFQRVPVIIMLQETDVDESDRADFCGCDSQLHTPANSQAFASEVGRFIPAVCC